MTQKSDQQRARVKANTGSYDAAFPVKFKSSRWLRQIPKLTDIGTELD